MKDFDDKDLVIFAVTIICLASIFWLPEAKEIVLNIITGLMGIAVGQSLKASP